MAEPPLVEEPPHCQCCGEAFVYGQLLALLPVCQPCAQVAVVRLMLARMAPSSPRPVVLTADDQAFLKFLHVSVDG